MVLNCPECDANFGYVRKMIGIYLVRLINWLNRKLLKTYPLIEDCARCRDCGRNVHDYKVPDEIWNAVIGSPNGVWCYDCFCDRADRKGIYWRAGIPLNE